VSVKVLINDGNIREAAGLAYQLACNLPPTLIFTYADLYKHVIRDPTLEEEQLSSSILTILISEEGVNLYKTAGAPIAASDFSKLLDQCIQYSSSGFSNLHKLKQTGEFVGKLYSLQ
jgi:exosome complex RNA-binding protein Rrp42 (RNase PH superfamily)